MGRIRLPHGFTAREWLLLTVLLAVMFVHIVDFVLIMPLGPMLMRSLGVQATQFALLVGVYTLTAGAAGLIAALWMDRFDRKRALLVLLAGFGAGTLLCGLATSYGALLAARALAGAFGGILASVALAIIGDSIAAERRATATGVVMSGFSAASVLGLPLGLMLAERGGWQLPFLVLGGATALILCLAALSLPRMTSHLRSAAQAVPARATPAAALGELWDIARDAEHVKAFSLMAVLMLSSFSLFPFMSLFLTANAGLPEHRLDLVYFCGGLAALVTGPTLFGPLADRLGHARVFVAVSAVCIAPIAIVTNLGVTPVWGIVTLMTFMMAVMTGRMISAMALITGVVDRARRGRFMSLNAAVQHAAAAAASMIGGLVVAGGNGTPITGYAVAGGISILAILLTMPLALRLRSAAEPVTYGEPAPDGAAAAAAP